MSTPESNYLTSRVLAWKKSSLTKMAASEADKAKKEFNDPTDQGTVVTKPDADATAASETTPEKNKDTADRNDNTSGLGENKDANINVHDNPEDIQLPTPANGSAEDLKQTMKGTSSMSKLASQLTQIKERLSKSSQQASVKTASAEKRGNEGVAPEAPQQQQDGELSVDFLLKVANAVVQTEEGRAFGMNLLSESLGADIAADLIKRAAVESEQLEAAASEEHFIKQAAAAYQQQVAQEFHSLPADKQQLLVKKAGAHLVRGRVWEEHGDLVKSAFDAGAQDYDRMAELEEEGIPLEEAVLGPEGDEGEVTAEDIAIIEEILNEEVAKGTISEEQAVEILEEIIPDVDGMAAAEDEAALLEAIPDLANVPGAVDEVVA